MLTLLGKLIRLVFRPVGWAARSICYRVRWTWPTIFRFIDRGLIVLFVLALLVGWYVSPLRAISRDAVVAIIAEWSSGPDVPLDDVGYEGSALFDSSYTWGILTNSRWLLGQTTLIVPYMEFEGLTAQGWYPLLIGWMPFLGERSFTVAGTQPFMSIYMNERYVLDVPWADKRDALGTLTHEIIHVQRGAFRSGTSAELESATSAATLEVLAAMCQYGHETACGAFWELVKTEARGSLYANLYNAGLGFLYTPFSDLWLRTGAESDYAHKLDRYWADKMDQRLEIIEKYYRHPWQVHIIRGLHGRLLNTGNLSIEEFGKRHVLGMQFDDTQVTLGALRWFIVLLSP